MPWFPFRKLRRRNLNAPPHEPAAHDRFRSALTLARFRLRIPLILLVTALLIGRWEQIANHWDMLTRHTPSENIKLHAVSSDTEYFCPMDPGVLSEWPGRCGVCNMALVRRKRGEAVVLPEGVVSRMQISPYRLQLAGIRTEPAVFLPLLRECSSSGIADRQTGQTTVTVPFAASESPYLAAGDSVTISSPDLPARDSLSAKIRKLTSDNSSASHHVRAEIDIADPTGSLSPGMLAVVHVQTPMGNIEPFRSIPTNPPPNSASDPKRVYRCTEHPQKLSTKSGRCPIDQNPLDPYPLTELERVGWWCPMHPKVTANQPGSVCKACSGMPLEPRILSFRPAGQVLAIPESAVVDTGDRKVVFIETMPGLFEGVEVTLGVRCHDRYPVFAGIEPGQRIAVSGAFLLDAESRLNPALASSYFGAARGERSPTPTPAPSGNTNQPPLPALAGDLALALHQLTPADLALAMRQQTCPVTRMTLGSMGQPKRITLEGQTIFLCCDGCEPKITAQPSKYLAILRDSHRP